MQYKFELLKKGETVLNVWDNKIAVKKASGEVEIFQYNIDESGYLRLEKDTVLITFGTGIIRVKDDDSSLEVGTF